MAETICGCGHIFEAEKPHQQFRRAGDSMAWGGVGEFAAEYVWGMEHHGVAH
jgi:hypothetical protein